MTHIMYEKIYGTVSRIPCGKVATYGQIAKLAGLSGQARLIGYALHSLPGEMDIPWHRVINVRGEISKLPDPESVRMQRFLLEQEGIAFDRNGKVDLHRFQWQPSDG